MKTGLWLVLILTSLMLTAWVTAGNRAGGAAGAGLPAWSGSQPIAFPHDLHLKAGVRCLDCHSDAASSPQAGIPGVRRCELCHARIAAGTPEIRKLQAYARLGREIPWQRVVQFPASAHVQFRHDMHVQSGIQCATCHGDMTHVTTARVLRSQTMGRCVECHRLRGASTECNTCHN